MTQRSFRIDLVLTVFLTISFLASCTGIIVLKHKIREQFTLMGQTQRDMDNAHLEWSQLLLEQATLANGARVNQEATTKLQMKAPNDKEIRVLE